MNQDNGGVIGKINTPTTLVASGVWSIQDQFEAQSSSTWPLAFPQTTFTNTCRFDDGSSDYLTKTFSSAGNRKTWTWSGWVKRCTLGAQQDLLSVSSGSSAYHLWYIDSNDGVTHNYNGTYVSSAPKFRDVSAWYHFVCAVDTTQSTAADRVKMYVNGSQITSFDAAGYPSQDADLSINNNVRHDISNGGAHFSNNFYLDGYMAEVVFVDGQALTPTSFGATNPITNIWEPIAYAGTYGTNGFKLNFADSSNLGDDTSGNTNDFTVNNLTSIDQSTDTPSNNFATLNFLDSGTITFSDGNLTVVSESDYHATKGTIGVNTGKWYFEAKINTPSGGSTVDNFIGITGDNTAVTGTTYDNNPSVIYTGSGTIEKDGTEVQSSLATFSTGTIVGVALNMDDSEIEFYVDGSKQGSTQSISSFTGFYLPFYIGSNDRTASFNFGAPPYSISSGNADANGHGNFEYAVPSGYFALNTKNLSEFG